MACTSKNLKLHTNVVGASVWVGTDEGAIVGRGVGSKVGPGVG